MNNPAELHNKIKRKSILGGSPRLRNIPRNWLHQAFFYMDRTEMVFRGTLEVIVWIILCGSLRLVLGSDWNLVLCVFVAAIVTHTLFWITNGNWWALMIFTFPGLRNSGAEMTKKYLLEMADRARLEPHIAALAVYGSVARGTWHDKSDFDVRILREPGIVNGIRASTFTTRERFIAFMAGQPLDVFLADDTKFLQKMRSDEKPVVLYKSAITGSRAFSDPEADESLAI